MKNKIILLVFLLLFINSITTLFAKNAVNNLNLCEKKIQAKN